MAEVQRQSIHFCAFRVARLSSTGAPLSGATNGYVTNQQVDLQYTPQYAAADKFEVKNGCGDIIVSEEGQPRLTGVNLVLNVLANDPEFFELLASFSLVTTTGNDTGYSAPAVGAVGSNGVSIEGWTKRKNGSADDSSFPYWKVIFPKTVWTPAAVKLDNGVVTWPFDGVGYENSAIGDGPFNDWANVTGGQLGRLWTWDQAATIPTAAVGYSSVPLQ